VEMLRLLDVIIDIQETLKSFQSDWTVRQVQKTSDFMVRNSFALFFVRLRSFHSLLENALPIAPVPLKYV